MTKRVSPTFPIILLLSMAAPTLGGQADQAPTASPVALEAQIEKTIVFLTFEVNEKGKTTLYSATGFLVGVPDERLPKGKEYIYLVTNRHVAEAIENCKSHKPEKFFVMMNLKEPANGTRSLTEPLQVSAQNPWHVPKDPSVDLAVLFFAQFSLKYDHIVLPLENLLTSKELAAQSVIPSYKVLTMGLFSQHPGTRGLQPLVREGVLAMMPDAPMQTTTCKLGNVYLADLHIIPGNSGSPIFITPVRSGGGVTLSGERNAFGLLGVISGYMYEDNSLTLRPSTNWSGTVRGNSGIAMVVPAEELKTLLLSPEVQHQRYEFIASLSAQKP